MKKDENTIPALEIKDLSVSFSMYDKGWHKKELEVIHELSVKVMPGEILAVVGSSGSGKSILAHAALGLLPKNATVSGRMEAFGQELTKKQQEKLRGHEIAFIPQSVDYLDPLMKIKKQVTGVWGTEEKQKALFEKYQLEEKVGEMYPFQLSGGMARRVLISTAMMGEPKLIIADEPTPGLSKELAMETLQHFRSMADMGCGVLLITHGIDLAFEVADKIAVFYAGTTVEVANVEDFKQGADALRHPYSKAFLRAFPGNEFEPIEGFQPYAGNLPSGCLFADRCPMRTDACQGEIPMRELRKGEVRCVNAT